MGKRLRSDDSDDAGAEALRIAHELEEDGDSCAARQCVEYAVSQARAASSDGVPLADAELLSRIAASAPNPPAALIASVGLALVGSLARDAGDLVQARCSLEESLRTWPGNAEAQCTLADLELHNGALERALLLYEAAACQLPWKSELSVEGWPAELVAKPRAAAVATASYMLSLLLHLLGRFDAGVPHLQRLGVRLRLAPAVWEAIAATPSAASARLPAPRAPPRDASCDVARYAHVVPPALMRQLKAAFGPRSSFWDETGYASRGYFSFWQGLTSTPTNAIGALAHCLLPLTGCAERVVGIEWWVHSKKASRALGNAHGHQLHYDTEEGVLYASGQLMHPAVSSVLYLSGGSVGGPTVVLDQRYGEAAPAARAFVSHPAEDTVLLFPGDRLHGVCPSRPSMARAAAPARARRGEGHAPLCSSARLPRRVTLMIGFWTADVAAMLPRAPLTACGPLPRASRACTWPALLELGGAPPEPRPEPAGEATREAVAVVSPAWETVPSPAPAHGGGGRGGGARESLSPLDLPCERDNHYFVRSIDDDLRFEGVEHEVQRVPS